MLNLWKRLGQYEKTVLALLLGFIIFSAGYFSVSLSGARCPLCQNKFEPNESYLWDARTGDIFPLSDYSNAEYYSEWLAGKDYVPQETSPAEQRGYARFPDEIFSSPNYCPSHRSLFGQSEYFLVLHADTNASVCYAVPDREITTPNGHHLKKQFNDYLNCWEIEIRW